MAQEEEPQPWQTVAPVEFVPGLKDQSEAQALLIRTRQGAGYAIAGGQLAHAVESRATHVLMDFSRDACAIRYQIDGQWEQLPPLDRQTGDEMLVAMKQLCLMNPADRRGRQSGKIRIKAGKTKIDFHLQTQGVPSGERAIGRLEPDEVPFKTLAELGMRDKMIESFKAALNAQNTVLMISASKGEGLTTLWAVGVGAADRLIRDFQSFEPQDNPEPEIINISSNFFGGDTGMSEVAMVQRMALKEPDVFMFPNMPQPDSLKVTLEAVVTDERQIYLRAVANSALEAVAALIERFPSNRKLLIEKLGAVIHGRLVRRLCDECKIGFEPPPALLKQLGIPPGRVAVLYQPFIPPPIEQQVDENGRPAPIEPCHVCDGRGYFGRVGLFELLQPGAELRAALKKTTDVVQLNQIAKAEGHRTLQSEAVLTVARGLTSLDELKKAFAKR